VRGLDDLDDRVGAGTARDIHVARDVREVELAVGPDVDGAGGAFGLLVAPVLTAVLTLAIALLLRPHAGRRGYALRVNLAAGRQCREHPKDEDDGSERC